MLLKLAALLAKLPAALPVVIEVLTHLLPLFADKPPAPVTACPINSRVRELKDLIEKKLS